MMLQGSVSNSSNAWIHLSVLQGFIDHESRAYSLMGVYWVQVWLFGVGSPPRRGLFHRRSLNGCELQRVSIHISDPITSNRITRQTVDMLSNTSTGLGSFCVLLGRKEGKKEPSAR